MDEWIRIRGARQHNLKNIDVAIPKRKLVVVTGPSGAGKSSLAFDTLYAEGHRRYVEALSPQARQFLGQLDKPDMDGLEGLSPAIAVSQSAGSPSPRSTVGTASDVHDYLRLLYARVAVPHCHRCGTAIRGHTVQQIVDEALDWPEQPRLLVCAPLAWDAALDWAAWVRTWQQEGFVRLRVGGTVHLIEEGVPEPEAGAAVELVVDRLALKGVDRQRLTDAVELALHHGRGLVTLVRLGEGEVAQTFSRSPRCPNDGTTYPEPEPRLFSFNSPDGACPTCQGLGRVPQALPARVVPDPGKNLAEGAIAPWAGRAAAEFGTLLEQVAEHYGFSIFTPFRDLAPAHQRALLQGSGGEEIVFRFGDRAVPVAPAGPGSRPARGRGRSAGKAAARSAPTRTDASAGEDYRAPFEGVIPHLERRYALGDAATRERLSRWMAEQPCPDCHGERLRIESRHFLLGEGQPDGGAGRSIGWLSAQPLEVARDWVAALHLGAREARIAERLLAEVRERLGFLVDVGLAYLTLERGMGTLSSGESQRIRLATQLGSALSGVIYILDEPTVGLHQQDTARLIQTLQRLRDAGNTVLVVEHDKDMMAAADWLIEIGPRGGEAGGHLVAAGTPAQVQAVPESLTGAYLAGRRGIALPATRHNPDAARLELLGARGHTLQDVELSLPLGLFACITGPSGSGKSTLLLDTLLPALQSALRGGRPTAPLPFRELRGWQHLERVIHVDQAPLGRSARSNPATALGVFAVVREQFAAVPESRARGYGARRFSFNVEGGRCEACQGEGQKRIEMHFLPDVYVTCDVCHGARFNRETLEIRYRGRSIADVLALTCEEAEAFFRAIPAIRTRLQPMLDVGLGYLRLGQSAKTLSGGEAQRLKIARELGRGQGGARTLYLLDEPTTGLHVEDIERLLAVLTQLVRQGASVVVIEHNLEMIKCADWVIDLGPGGGAAGGRIVAAGTPEDLLAAAEESATARHLHTYLLGPGSARRGPAAQ